MKLTSDIYESNTQTALQNALALAASAPDTIVNGSKRDVAALAAQVGISFAVAGVNALLAVAAGR